MDKDNIHIIAFSIPKGHFEWMVIPFELKNAPQIFLKKNG